MKMISKAVILLSLFFLTLLFLPQSTMAQPDIPYDCPDPDVACPIDGGVGLLIAAGVAYGILRVRARRN